MSAASGSARLGADAAAVPARIGPNAITRVVDALAAAGGEPLAAAVLARAGLARYLHAPPRAMVDEREVAALHRALHATLPAAQARRVARDAGRATAAYLLAHRIPQPVQRLLRVLPAPLAARVLLGAIRRHAWTFAGSGRFGARAGRPVVLELRGNPLHRDGPRSPSAACDYHAATFEALFRALVHRDARVAEPGCEGRGDAACRFEIRWGRLS